MLYGIGHNTAAVAGLAEINEEGEGLETGSFIESIGKNVSVQVGRSFLSFAQPALAMYFPPPSL